MVSTYIVEQVRRLPSSPGVYLMKDAAGTILYVGKASSLHNRVSSYFGSSQKLTPKVRQLVSRVTDLEYFVTGSEQEALILELNLIKRYRPHYNVRLKDDSGYPYLKIDLKADWPRLYVTRRLEDDGARYFGPFTSSRSVRDTLKVIKGIFPLRPCTKVITGRELRPCLEYDIGHCLAPCTGAVTRREYAAVIRQVILFLEGKQEKVVRQLKVRMGQAAAALQFETAGALRDRIQAVQRVVEEQRISTRVKGEVDAIAFVPDRDQAFAQVFFIRGSKIVGRESFMLQGTRDEEPGEVMASFVEQFYGSSPHIPPLLLLQHPVANVATIQSWLQGKRGGGVRIEVPRRGNKKELIDIVAENARRGLEQLKIKQMAAPPALPAALEEVKSVLGLAAPPERIEGYDISNIQGTAAVGSLVVFEHGQPRSGHYRRFRIKTVPAANDYAMLQEVLTRRFKRAGLSADSWAVIPDLVLIDGGKGQVSAAREAMVIAGAGAVTVAGLAKENEEIFIPGRSQPIVLPKASPGLQLLQRVRDEAHRFALGYHLKVRQRGAFASALDGVPGIGPRRKRALLRRFGSVRAIKEATVEELADAAGMNRSAALRVKEQL
jgi:excinuclease ABC subunit C